MEDSECDEDEKEESCEDSDDVSEIVDKFGGKKDVAKQASKDKGPEIGGQD